MDETGMYLVVGKEHGTITTYDNSGKELAKFNPGNARLDKVGIAPGGCTVVASWHVAEQGLEPHEWGRTLRVFDLRLNTVNVESNPALWITAIDFSPEGKYFAVSALDRTQLRESATGKLVWEHRGLKADAICMAQDAERSIVISHGSDFAIIDKAGRTIGSSSISYRYGKVRQAQLSSDLNRLAILSDMLSATTVLEMEGLDIHNRWRQIPIPEENPTLATETNHHTVEYIVISG